MEPYVFSEVVEEGFSLNFEPSLFNQKNHRLLQRASGWRSFFILHTKRKKIYGAVYFNIEKSTATTSVKSPFGSFEFADDLPPLVLYGFIRFCEEQLLKAGIKEITIKNPPTVIHAGNAALLHTFLFNLGYQIQVSEVGAVIIVRDHPFNVNLDSFEQRRIRQAIEEGLTAKKEGDSELQSVFEFILRSRNAKGFPLSMTWPEMKLLSETCQENILLFTVRKENTLVAAAIVIKVRSNVLYNFYVAHDEQWDHLSPVVLMTAEIYRFATEKNFRYIDLGTSAIDGQPNFSLLDFKIRLGAEVSQKLTFVKRMA